MKVQALSTEETGTRLFDLTLTGRLSLDFANTVEWRTGDHPEELLNSYADLARWSRHTGLLTERAARHLLREAARRPEEAQTILDEAKDLRETIFRTCSAVATGHQPAKSDIDRLNARLSEALSHLQVARVTGGFTYEWANTEDRLDSMLWAVARATGELLVDAEALAQLRECAGAGCGWLFVDTSRNKSRRWCMMGICGNRAKARRHYEQVKSGR